MSRAPLLGISFATIFWRKSTTTNNLQHTPQMPTPHLHGPQKQRWRTGQRALQANFFMQPKTYRDTHILNASILAEWTMTWRSTACFSALTLLASKSSERKAPGFSRGLPFSTRVAHATVLPVPPIVAGFFMPCPCGGSSVFLSGLFFCSIICHLLILSDCVGLLVPSHYK